MDANKGYGTHTINVIAMYVKLTVGFSKKFRILHEQSSLDIDWWGMTTSDGCVK